jgi:flagellar motility protein MotE (MotC chaperone)
MAAWKHNRLFYFFVTIQTLLLLTLLTKLGFSAFHLLETQEKGAARFQHRVAAEPERKTIVPAAAATDADWFKALQEKETALEKKRRQVEQKEKDLSRLQAEIEGKITQCSQAQAQLKKLVEEAKAVQDKKVQHLAEIFCAMPPEKAARLVDKMDDRAVTEVFQSMRSKEVGGILSQIEPTRAARISAGLSALTPRVQ